MASVAASEKDHDILKKSNHGRKCNNQEKNALETNLEAADEIARRLRLRDIGGIIVVDFIDMKLPENKKKLMEAMEKFMLPDRAKHAVVPISKFGLMQITRQRMKPEMTINTQEVCPSCSGTGKISSTIILEDEIEKDLSYLFTHQHNNLTVVVNPIIHAYLTKGWLWSKFAKWKKNTERESSFGLTQIIILLKFKFFDKNDDEIKLSF